MLWYTIADQIIMCCFFNMTNLIEDMLDFPNFLKIIYPLCKRVKMCHFIVLITEQQIYTLYQLKYISNVFVLNNKVKILPLIFDQD